MFTFIKVLSLSPELSSCIKLVIDLNINGWYPIFVIETFPGQWPYLGPTEKFPVGHVQCIANNFHLID